MSRPKSDLEALRQDLANLREQETELRARWENEKEPIEAMKAANVELEKARLEVEQAERETDLQRAAELKFGLIPELEGLRREQNAAGDEVARAKRRQPPDRRGLLDAGGQA